MSALPPKADKERTCWHVRFVPKADSCTAPTEATRSGEAIVRLYLSIRYFAKDESGHSAD